MTAMRKPKYPRTLGRVGPDDLGEPKVCTPILFGGSAFFPGRTSPSLRPENKYRSCGMYHPVRSRVSVSKSCF